MRQSLSPDWRQKCVVEQTVSPTLSPTWRHDKQCCNRRKSTRDSRYADIQPNPTMADYNGEKISFLVLNTERRYLPPRANEANQQNRKKAEGRKNHNNDKAVFFELEHPTTTTTTVTSMYTIHTQCQRNLLRCHQPGDSDTEVLNSK